ncbi:MAG: hypothetical protein Q8Q04_01830 [archaeon]|nr:hypothetical protein [archaeon]
MRFVAFNLKKVSGERYLNDFSDLNVGTSINLNSVEENKASQPRPGTIYLDVFFTYIIDYSKKVAKVELDGKVVLSVDEKIGKEILKNWKGKDLKDEIRVEIFNGILMKSNLKALQIEEDLGLPPHFKMPSLSIPKKE